MNIRSANADDLAAVHAIYADPRVAPGLGREPMSRDDFEPLFADMRGRPSFRVWELDGCVIGFHHQSLMSCSRGPTAFLGTIALAPDAQGRGLARIAMTLVLQALKLEGVRRVELIVDSANESALMLYRRLGFRVERTLERCSLFDGRMQSVCDHYMGMAIE